MIDLSKEYFSPISTIIRGHGQHAQDVHDNLRQRSEVVIRPKVFECCKDPSNLKTLTAREDLESGRIVQVCKHCYRRHIRVRVEPTRFGWTAKKVG